MIDVHCHVLPELDDGPKAIEGSLELARAARAAGTTTLIATPHVNRRYDVNLTSIEAGLRKLRARLAEEGIGLRLLMGGEISTGRLASLSDDELDALRLGGGPYLLIEAPLGPGLGTLPSAVERLQRDGFRVLIAHPERSPGFQRDPSKLAHLVDNGALCSITAASLSGQFGRTPHRFALALLREGLVHNVASDAHDAYRRSPDLRPGLAAAAARLGECDELAQWLTREVPAAIVEGAPLPPRPPLTQRSLRRRLLRRS
jgi:protein-tyrosine phosphatase